METQNTKTPAPDRRQVVIGYDFSPTSEIALDRGVDIACRAPQHVLHVVVAIDEAHPLPGLYTGKVDYDYAERVQQALSEKVKEAFATREAPGEVHFFVHARIGKPAKEILDLAKQMGADLIIVGSHGHTGVNRILFGSVSEAVVRRAECPVMVVRPKTYPHVELVDVVSINHDDPRHHTYLRPHRYSYSDRRVMTRPDSWPIP